MTHPRLGRQPPREITQRQRSLMPRTRAPIIGAKRPTRRGAGTGSRISSERGLFVVVVHLESRLLDRGIQDLSFTALHRCVVCAEACAESSEYEAQRPSNNHRSRHALVLMHRACHRFQNEMGHGGEALRYNVRICLSRDGKRCQVPIQR